MKDDSVVLSARNDLGAVRLSEDSAILLTIGPVTINLAPDAFAQTAILIRDAMESLATIVASGELYAESSDKRTGRELLPN